MEYKDISPTFKMPEFLLRYVSRLNNNYNNNNNYFTLNRFRSEYDSAERLGKGTFGRVFKARQKLDKKYFAIKIVRWKT